MAEKLGIVDSGMDPNQLEDIFTEEFKSLIEELFCLMTTCGSDFTNTFRDLAKLSKSVEIIE